MLRVHRHGVLDALVGIRDSPRTPHRTESVLGDAAVVGHLAIAVAYPFPGVDGSEVGWMLGRRPPLDDREVRDARHADLTVAPRLGAGPLDQVVDVHRLLG